MLFSRQSCLMLALRRQVSTKVKVTAVLDEHTLQEIESEKIKFKQHPGRMRVKNNAVPILLQRAINTVLKDKNVKNLVVEGQALDRYMKGRHAPVNLEEVKGKRRSQIYSWKAIDFDEHKSLQYLVGRIDPDFAILNQIFAEFKIRLPNFVPSNVFDFGSGVGSVAWAVQSQWGKALKEIYCVDASPDMINLAEILQKRGDPDGELPIPGMYFRQFLPASQSHKYDIVVSAFSLFELPSTESRLSTLHNLWGKTKHFLILVEQGTNAAFKLIDEAKEFVLYLSQTSDSAYIFAPCPHEAVCPRAKNVEDNTPCNFEVTYLPFLTKKSTHQKDRYCYVIIGKGKRPDSLPNWPRIVRPTLVRTRHSICRLCTSQGNLEEIIFTPAKHGKITYQCARSSEWGDILPINIKHNVPECEETDQDLTLESDPK